MDPITIGIIAAATLLSGGGTYVVTKGRSQKRILELQEQVRELQERLQQAQGRIVELQRRVADLQNRLVERENRIAELLEREANLQLVIEEVSRRVELNSAWWRRAIAIVLFRYRRLLKETEELRAKVAQSQMSLDTARELRSTADIEARRLRDEQRAVDEELKQIEQVCEQLLTTKRDADRELAELLA